MALPFNTYTDEQGRVVDEITTPFEPHNVIRRVRKPEAVPKAASYKPSETTETEISNTESSNNLNSVQQDAGLKVRKVVKKRRKVR